MLPDLIFAKRAPPSLAELFQAAHSTTLSRTLALSLGVAASGRNRMAPPRSSLLAGETARALTLGKPMFIWIARAVHPPQGGWSAEHRSEKPHQLGLAVDRTFEVNLLDLPA